MSSRNQKRKKNIWEEYWQKSQTLRKVDTLFRFLKKKTKNRLRSFTYFIQTTWKDNFFEYFTDILYLVTVHFKTAFMVSSAVV